MSPIREDRSIFPQILNNTTHFLSAVKHLIASPPLLKDCLCSHLTAWAAAAATHTDRHTHTHTHIHTHTHTPTPTLTVRDQKGVKSTLLSNCVYTTHSGPTGMTSIEQKKRKKSPH